MTDATFTLEHDEQRYRVQLSHNGKVYAVWLTIYGTGRIRVIPYPSSNDGQFRFDHSSPQTVLMIGKLLIAAAKKGGATEQIQLFC